MLSINEFANRPRLEDQKNMAGTPDPGRRKRRAWIMLFGLALWSAGFVAGCGGSTEPQTTPEQKSKQQVVQEKMKEFMQKKMQPGKGQRIGP
jgi:hypothetical protein